MAERGLLQRASGGNKLSRAQKGELTRTVLLDAGVDVVGEVGYAQASIAAITRRAGVAQGTFYNYFETREQMFDHLLPHLGRRMLDFIRDRIDANDDEGEREEQGFRAFLLFLEEHPAFYRVLYEAETFAPRAYETHTRMVARGFARVLGRSATSSTEPPVFSDRELEAVAYMLMGIRHYVAMRYGRKNGRPAAVPDWVVDTYMRLLRGGLSL